MENTPAPENQKPSQMGQSSVSDKKQISQQISQRTILLIFALAGITLFFLYLALRPQLNQPQISRMVPTAAPSPTPYAQSVLTIAPATSSSPSKGMTYNVTINGNANIVNAVQLEMTFDPKALSNITLAPGPFFTNPVILIKNIDYTNGRISYALGIQPQDHGVKGQGVVATISFQSAPGATTTNTALTFTPKTLVAAEGVTQSVLNIAQSSQSVTIPLGQ